MRRYSCIIVISLVLLCWSQGVFAASVTSISGPVKKGNKLYKREDFEGALKEYEKAQQDLPDSDIVNFNTGAAFYKKGDYQQAIDAFTKSLVTENPDIEAKADYNIGNAKYRQAQKAESADLQAAAALLKESLDYYQRAIELDDKDEQAKANYEFVKKKAEELLKKMQQQEKQAQAQQAQQQAEQAKEEQGSKGKTGEDEEKEKELSQAAPKEEDKEKEEGKKAAKEGAEEMSQEQALMLLEGYRQEEEAQGQVNFQKKEMRYPKVLKDW